MTFGKWSELIGKNIIAFRGYPIKTVRGEEVPLEYALFDDKETFIEFREQDPYDYHDCNGSARIMRITKDAQVWERLFSTDELKEPTNLGTDPF